MRFERGISSVRTAWLSAVVATVMAAGGLSGSDLAPDQAQAESELRSVLRQIDRLKEELEAAREAYREEQSRLRGLELDIQQTRLAYRALERERDGYDTELERLERERAAYLSSLDHRLESLADQIRMAYRLGKQSRLKLVLNQDDPSRLSRLLAYYDYFNRAQVRRISELRETLTALEEMQRSIDRELMRIDSVQREQQAVLDRLGRQRSDRNRLLADLSRDIGSGEARLQELERNRRDLEALIERLSSALADIPAELGDHLGVERQKGMLAMPVEGPVRHAFGQRRSAGLDWRGWLIGAERGMEVRAVAYGRVAFADWLRGYGLIIIIDHGAGFMSLYAHNEALLQEAGDWVEPGEAISIVGENPASGQGLYFEIRKDGKALDPAAWIAR